MNILKLIPLIGSLFVKPTADGTKTQVAVVPSGTVLYALSGVACYAQTSEPFSQCVERLWPLIGGLFQ